MKQGKQETAVIVVLARYQIKRNGAVIYLVKSSRWTPENQITYCVTLVAGRTTGCTCEARNGHCKHREAMQRREYDRQETRREHVPLNGNRPFSLLR